MEKEKRAKDADAALAAVRHETAQRCAEIAQAVIVTTDFQEADCDEAHKHIAAAITKEFGPWE